MTVAEGAAGRVVAWARVAEGGHTSAVGVEGARLGTGPHAKAAVARVKPPMICRSAPYGTAIPPIAWPTGAARRSSDPSAGENAYSARSPNVQPSQFSVWNSTFIPSGDQRGWRYPYRTFGVPPGLSSVQALSEMPLLH
jgi:hypothetical protein